MEELRLKTMAINSSLWHWRGATKSGRELDSGVFDSAVDYGKKVAYEAITRFIVRECLLLEGVGETQKMLDRADISLSNKEDVKIMKEENVYWKIKKLLT